MAWRSPFPARHGGVPFPALTPWVSSSSAKSPELGSPMQTSPVFRSIPKRGTGVRSSPNEQASPMDAAPYTPVSARLDPGRNSAPESALGPVGRLSFTPHATRQSSPAANSASRQSLLQRKSRFSHNSPEDRAQLPQLPSLYGQQNIRQDGTAAAALDDSSQSPGPSTQARQPSAAPQLVNTSGPDARIPGTAAIPGSQSSTLDGPSTAGPAFVPGPALGDPSLTAAQSASYFVAAQLSTPSLQAGRTVSPLGTDAAASQDDASPSLRSRKNSWQPMGRVASTPDKQDLGRRIFGGLPATPSSAGKKQHSQTPHKAATPSAPQGHGRDTTGLVKPNSLSPAEATPSPAEAGPSPAEAALGNMGHAESISQLQLQAAQAATESCVPILCISASEGAAVARPQRDAKTRTEALSKLRQLTDAAQPLAAKLDVRVTEHAVQKPLAGRQVGVKVLPEDAKQLQEHHAAPQASSVLRLQALTDKAKLRQGLTSDSANRLQNIASMLNRLQILQDEGSKLAQNLQLQSQH